MPIEIRTIDPDETGAWLRCLRTGFLANWPVEPIAADVRTLWDYRRVWAATEGPAIIGTTRSWATELTVPGEVGLPGSAIAAVSVLPSHRRRGVLGRLMTAEMDAARERGEAVAVLWASHAAIYGRFGFGPATRSATWTVDAGPGSIPGTSRPGALTVVEPSVEARDLIRGLYEEWRVRQPGEIRRREFTWDDALGLRAPVRGDDRWDGTLVVHRDPSGRPDGYVRYHLEERWQDGRPTGTLHIDELHALTDEAYRDLWRLACSLDWVATVRAEQRSPQERLPWLVSDGRAARPATIIDGLWLALLDVPAALAARRYEHAGRLTLALAPTAHQPEERVLLDAGPDGVTCRRTSDTPDLVVERRALAAAYLGGVSLCDATVGGGVDEHRPGALATLDRLLHTLDGPWCSTFF